MPCKRDDARACSAWRSAAGFRGPRAPSRGVCMPRAVCAWPPGRFHVGAHGSRCRGPSPTARTRVFPRATWKQRFGELPTVLCHFALLTIGCYFYPYVAYEKTRSRRPATCAGTWDRAAVAGHRVCAGVSLACPAGSAFTARGRGPGTWAASHVASPGLGAEQRAAHPDFPLRPRGPVPSPLPGGWSPGSSTLNLTLTPAVVLCGRQAIRAMCTGLRGPEA